VAGLDLIDVLKRKVQATDDPMLALAAKLELAEAYDKSLASSSTSASSRRTATACRRSRASNGCTRSRSAGRT
jgi:hypothetical protein